MTVDMYLATCSEAYAKKCYLNYYYKNNSMGITAAQMGQIMGTWDSKVNSWKAYAESADENDYEIDDSDYEDAVNRGRRQAEDESGYENTTGQQIGQGVRTGVDAGVAVVGNTVGKKGIETGLGTGAKEGVKEGTKQGTKEGVKEGTKQGTKEGTKQGAKEATKEVFNWAIIASCALDAVEAAAYRISKPNETQKKAVDTYSEGMDGQMGLTLETQDNLATMDEELICNTDEANMVNDDANEAMAETKTDYDFHAQAYEYLQKEKVRGHQFTQEETELWEECVEYMNRASEDIAVQQDEAQAQLTEIYEDMESYQDGFDESAENIGNVEGYAAEAASVDKSTQTQCYIEAGSQGVNALSAGVDAYKAISMGSASVAFGIGAAYLAAGAVAAVAALSDGAAAAEQFTWAGETGKEIEKREATQETNAETLAVYDENVDYYEGYMSDVEGLELVVPDAVAPVDDGETPEPEDPSKDPKKK